MSNYYNAFDMSPVPAPGVDAVAPESFRGIYGMPMFVAVPARDLAASERFWQDGMATWLREIIEANALVHSVAHSVNLEMVTWS